MIGCNRKSAENGTALGRKLGLQCRGCGAVESLDGGFDLRTLLSESRTYGTHIRLDTDAHSVPVTVYDRNLPCIRTLFTEVSQP